MAPNILHPTHPKAQKLTGIFAPALWLLAVILDAWKLEEIKVRG